MVSCTEIVKRRYRQSKPPIFQLTKISYRTFEEHWDPKTEDLEPLKVTREIPQIDILLKKQASDSCDISDNSKINMNNATLDVFLNITTAKNNATKRKKLKVMVNTESIGISFRDCSRVHPIFVSRCIA